MKDVGNECVYCGVDTSFGSGNFVNRIPASTEDKEGYMCPTCQTMECDFCGELVLEYEFTEEGAVGCLECLELREEI